MAFSATRLTLYALISAMESDLRRLIKKELASQYDATDIIDSDLLKAAKSRLEKDLGVMEDTPSIDYVLYYIDFGDLFQILNRNRKSLLTKTATYIREITPELESIVPIRNRVAHTRPLHFEDFPTVIDFSKKAAQNSDDIWVDLQDVLVRLETDQSFVLGLKIPTYDTGKDLANNLPIPDFDDTGFIGREDDVNKLIRLCFGPYPVITIVGEGGIGKTSLALKVAYDLMDLPNNPFQAIVWTTAKSKQLTASQIREIDYAISDSLGMIRAISDELSGQKTDNPMEEVLSYMKEFRILLILDNLETVLDSRIRTFMQELPAGSKVLITSRLGLGAFDVPVTVSEMSQRDAIELLRTFAKNRGVKSLYRLGTPKLAAYCARMKHSPLFMKWFVSAVQTGRRPEEIFANPDMFLDFCMSDVYSYLSENSRMVLKSMQAVAGAHSQAELAFLNQDMDTLELQKSLTELLTTNMVRMISIESGASFESTYDISDLARIYLANRYPLSQAELRKFTERRKRLSSAKEQIAADRRLNPYSAKSIQTRSKNDYIVAKYLQDVLKAIRANNLDEAERKMTEAQRLSPDFFEVHRVEAYLRSSQGNIPAAKRAYEAALDLEPNSAALHYWYGRFLMSSIDDTEASIVELKKAAGMDPHSLQIQAEISRGLLYLRHFTEARSILDSLLSQSGTSNGEKHKIHDLNLQYYQRNADHLESQHDNSGALEQLGLLQAAYLSIPNEIRDREMLAKLEKAIVTANRCHYWIKDKVQKEHAQEIINWLEKTARGK